MVYEGGSVSRRERCATQITTDGISKHSHWIYAQTYTPFAGALDGEAGEGEGLVEPFFIEAVGLSILRVDPPEEHTREENYQFGRVEDHIQSDCLLISVITLLCKID
ncbi:hypothetical protein FOCC_FOCC004839 [Frankliniella occidentalis]|nr:hypothetical protein FOCC_FOCC004839 [Frankliniella occidentalis]